MLATYPDVFAAGAVMSGLPYGCAHSTSDAYTCMNPGKNQSASAWASAARAGDSGYGGPWPRVSIWHGSSDYTVAEANAADSVLQWTGVNGIAATAAVTETVGKATHTEYKDSSGRTLVERWSISGMGHGTPVDPSHGCGTAGAYILDVGLCSTKLAWAFFNGASTSGTGSDAGATDSGSTGSDAGATDSGSTPPSDAGATDSGSTPADGGTPGWTCEAFTDTNYDHVLAGRADRCGIGGSYVCARGSGIQFGLWVMMPSTLRETAPGYYEPGNCP
jgi:hypothetical protein